MLLLCVHKSWVRSESNSGNYRSVKNLECVRGRGGGGINMKTTANGHLIQRLSLVIQKVIDKKKHATDHYLLFTPAFSTQIHPFTCKVNKSPA